MSRFENFANQLMIGQLQHFSEIKKSDQKQDDSGTIRLKNNQGDAVLIDLIPFEAQPQPVTASDYFSAVASVDDLFGAYQQIKKEMASEWQIYHKPENHFSYALLFLDNAIKQARKNIDDAEAMMIANWLKELDQFVAVKAFEGLCQHKAGRILLKIAVRHQWHIYFDHLAIRCGSAKNQDAEIMVKYLCDQHSYVKPQLSSQSYYLFEDGWDAYPLYKILNNGQVLRLFIDQSSASDQHQIIQHWNAVYGLNAHHLAMRMTSCHDGQIKAVPLATVMKVLNAEGVDIMEPTGLYTHGLLEQVFTKPTKDDHIPAEMLQSFEKIEPSLPEKIRNATLLELVSRQELDVDLAWQFMELYGLRDQIENNKVSAPVYQYFLPAQAAHVIKTSVM